MDDLAIVIKTKIELDEKQARAELDSLSKNLSGDNSAAKIKIKIGVDEKASKANIKAAIPSLTNSVSNKPIKIAFDIDKATSLKNIKAGIADIQKKIKNSKLKIDLDIGDVSGSAKGGGKSKKSTVPGIRYGNIKGSKKYADALRAQVDNYTKAFQDKGATLSDVNISYDPVKKMHSAVVKYQNEVGQTTSMVFKLKEGWEQVKVVQTRVHNSFKDYNKELEKSKKIVSDYEIKLANLKSKAFNQKDPIPDEHAGNLNRLISQIESTLNDVGNLVSTETSIALEKLFADANNEVAEIRSRIKTATSLRQKDVSSQKLVESNRIDTFIAKMKNAGVYTEEMKQSVIDLRTELDNVGDSDGLKKYLNNYDIAFSRFQALKEESRINLFDEQASSEYWNNRFVESISSQTSTSDSLKALRSYYEKTSKEAEKYYKEIIDAANKKYEARENFISESRKKAEKESTDYWNGQFVESINKQTSTNDTLKAMKKFYQDQEKIASEAQKKSHVEIAEANKLNQKKALAKSNIAIRINELKELGVYTGKVEKDFDKLSLSLGSIGSFAGFEKWSADLKQTEADLKSFLSSFQGQALSTANGIGGKQLSQIDTLLANQTIKSKQTIGVSSLRNELQELHNSYTALIDKMKAGDLTEAGFAQCEAELKELDIRLKSAANSAKIFDGSFKQNQNLEKAQQTIQKLRDQLENFKINTSAMQFPELRAEIERLEAALRGIDEVNVGNIQRQMTALGASIRATGANAKSFSAQIKDIFNEFKAYFSLADIVMTMARAFGDMAENVKAVNTSMTELKKVTSLTKAQYDALEDEAAQRAKDIGSSMANMIASTADASRLGFNIGDAKTMADASNIYLVVGDEVANIDEATKSLVSTTQAYGFAAGDALTIVDKLNAAGNNMAISSGGIGVALQHSASALAAANNTLDESIALIAAANRVVQDPGSVGNMWKTVAMRIRGAKIELEAAGEDTSDMVDSTATLQKMIKGMTGFDILEADQQTFKSTTEIILGIGKAWKSLEDIEQANMCLSA